MTTSRLRLGVLAAVAALCTTGASAQDAPRRQADVAQAALAPQAAPAQVLVPAPSPAPAGAAEQPPAATPTPPAAPSTQSPATPRAARQPGTPATPGAPADVATRDDGPHDRGRTSVRFASDYLLGRDDVSDDVVMIAGTATIEGHVTGDLVVILGTARLAPTAVVDGDVVTVGGNATVESGARVNGDLVLVAGQLTAPPEFRPGGEQVVLGPLPVTNGLRALVPWVTDGLLLGRPLVPSLPWMWALVAILFGIYLAIVLVFDRAVHACTETLAVRPLSAFAAGLLVLMLLLPVSLLLAVTVAGIAVIPLLYCAVFLAGLVGKVSVLCSLGARLLRPSDPDSRAQLARSFVLGFVVVTAVYMVPILGFVTWATLGALGLGASALAIAAALRRENPRPEPAAVPMPPPMPAAVPADAGAAVAAPAAPGQPVAPAGDASICPRATFLNRAGAFVLDLALVGLTYALLGIDDDTPGRFLLLLLAYRVVFWTWKGTTVGGIIAQTRVVRVDGTAVRFADALVRGLSSVFSFAVLGLGCLWMLRDQESQTWHDRIAGTYVVRVPRTWPLP